MFKILDTNYYVNNSRNGSTTTNIFGKWRSADTEDEKEFLARVTRVMMSRTRFTDDEKRAWFDESLSEFKVSNPESFLVKAHSRKRVESPVVNNEDSVADESSLDEIARRERQEKAKAVAQKLMDFFTEFHFEPNYRFVNTLAQKSVKSVKSAQEYICNYFKLTDSPFAPSVSEKIKSPEFKDICSDLKDISTAKVVNSRLKLYYGSQGTGKTTLAMGETGGNCMVCHSAMLPSDLMEDFKFDDGKAGFNPSALYKAIVNGSKIVLDEINLLPFESLRFLQSITDGKPEFEYKGDTVHIKDGFQIIGTMNLVVNGATYSLPEPLVDRAEDLKEFRLTADNLAGALV